MKRGRIYVHVSELPTGFGTGAAFWFSTRSTRLFAVLLGQTTTSPTVSGTVASALEKEKCRGTWNINVPLVAKLETPFRGQLYALLGRTRASTVRDTEDITRPWR